MLRCMVTRNVLIAGRVLSISCSRRVLLVAMSTQIMAYDLATMQMSYSAITYPAPNLKQPGDKGPSTTAVPLALGPRWLAHASNQVGCCSASWLASLGSRPGRWGAHWGGFGAGCAVGLRRGCGSADSQPGLPRLADGQQHRDRPALCQPRGQDLRQAHQDPRGGQLQVPLLPGTSLPPQHV